MFNLITIVVGLATLFTVTVAAALTNVGIVLPNVPVIAVVYAAVRRDVFGAFLTAFALGIWAGVLAGGGRGVLLLALIPVIGVTRWARGRLPLDSTLATAAWAIICVLVADFAFAFLSTLTEPAMAPWRVLTTVSPASALVSGIAAVPFYWFLGWIEPLLQERQGKSTLFR